MKLIQIAFLCFLMLVTDVQAQQGKTIAYDSLMVLLQEEAQLGNKRALRDLGSLLDKDQISDQVKAFLKEVCIFTDKELNFSQTVDRSKFHQFYYDNEENIQYSTLLNAYFLTAPEDRIIKYELKEANKAKAADNASLLRNFITKYQSAVASHKNGDLIQVINKIAELKTDESYEFLIEIINQKSLNDKPKEVAQNIYKTLCLHLEKYSKLKAVKSVLSVLKQEYIPSSLASKILANMTNMKIDDAEPSAKIIKFYNELIKTHGSLASIRTHGYEEHFNFRQSFFEHPVDYFGKILSGSDDKPWIEYNALLDLKEVEHPRALYYIACLLYKNRQRESSHASNFINQLIRLEIGVPNKTNKITFDPSTDYNTRLNYVIYWATHYKDYEWDANRKLFINKEEAVVQTENFEKLFRRLNSRNDSVAIQSFLKLTEGDPIEIINLAGKYRQLLRNYNRSLPSFKYQYLEQLVQLTDFCRKNNVSYKARSKIESILKDLKNTTTDKERYFIENKLINNVKAGDITAIEYWGCLNEGNSALAFSAGRIIDWYYSLHWEEIVNDDKQLRLYLKKSYLFENIGTIGSCNAYLNKFDISDKKLQERLNLLLKLESDEGIIKQIVRLTTAPEEESNLNIDAFITAPENFTKREIKLLPLPDQNQYAKIVSIIQKTDDKNSIKNLFYYLRLNPTETIIPHLFELIDDTRVIGRSRNMDIQVADYTIPILENLYSYSFPNDNKDKPFATEKWRALWEKDGKNYKNWFTTFFEESLQILTQKDTLTIEEINQIVESPYFTEQYKELCLSALKKVQPIKDIRKLNTDPKLIPKEDLKYFEDFDFSYKQLDDIPKLFDIKDPLLMLAYLERKSADFSISDKGSFYNSLFRSAWFASYVHQAKTSNDKIKKIKSILETYLNESDFISEFEEEQTNLNIAQIDNIARPLEEKLQASIQLDTDEGSKIKIQEAIIASIGYEEIGTVINYLDGLSVSPGEKPYDFLQKDFGLPIFDLEKQKQVEELINKHKKMSEYDFHLHYLKQFGVDFLANDGSLSFQKIYNILQFDIVTPFAGGGGGKRDQYTYGIIKLLELKFNTTLGFHKKLNEGQTFYSFSSSKRALMWRKYLEDNNLVDLSNKVPPSFNQSQAEN